MKVQIQLRKLLQDRGLDRRGIIQKISASTKLDRRVIAKYYNDEAPTVSLSVVRELCVWLSRHGVPMDSLPGSLFGLAHTELWPALAERGRVDLYLGEYLHVPGASPAVSSVSRRDAAVAADFVHQFSVPREGVKTPEIQFRYTRLQFPLQSRDVHAQPLADDIAAAGEAFRAMKNRRLSASSILIGSQRVNYLLEHYVANLFGCTPFQTPADGPRVPFFFVYRPGDHQTPSCFGGPRNPFYRRQTDTPGLHYLSSLRGGGHWRVRPWDQDRSDGGLVITVQNHATRAIELAVAGFSGRTTEALGRQLISNGDRFWPPKVQTNDMDIGIHICEVDFEDAEGTVLAGRDDTNIRNWTSIAMDERVIRKFLA
jgi:hypothetical protein